MSKIGLLIGALFKQQFRVDKSNKRSKSTKIVLFVAFGLMAVSMLPLLIVTLVTYSKACVELNAGQAYLSVVFTAIQTFALIFGTIMLVNTLFFSKDNTFLSTLPIKPQQVFFAKLLYVAVNELIFAGTVGLIAVIVYGVVAKMGVAFYVLSVIAIAISPIISLLVSSIFLFPLMYLLSYIKRNSTLTSVFSILLYVAFMVLYFVFVSKLQGNIDTSLQNTEMLVAMLSGLGKGVFFNYALSGIVLLQPVIWKNILIVVAVWGVGVLITYVLSGLVYRRGVTRQAEQSGMKIRSEGFKSGSLLKSLIKRDWKEIKRDNSLLFYCLMQIIMTPLMIILIFGVMYKGMDMDGEVNSYLINLMGMWFFIMFTCGTNYVATSAITRENRKWYNMKIMPVPYTLQIRAKVMLAYVFTAASTILGGICLMIFGVGILDGIFRIIVTLILGYGFVCWQVKLDLDKPRLNWSTIAEGLKNNPSSTITMFVSMAFGIVFGGITLISGMLPSMINISKALIFVIEYAILLIVSAIFAVLTNKSLYANTDKLFNKLEG